MPFRSKAQWRWMFRIDPERAKQWARETPGGYSSLPDHVEDDDRSRVAAKKSRTNPASPIAAEASKTYTRTHWGVPPDVVIEVQDDDIPATLVQMGTLHELRVSSNPWRGGHKFTLDFSTARPACHLAFSTTRDHRLYCILTDAELRQTRGLLRSSRHDPFQALAQLAEHAQGRQNRYPYPDIEVQCLGYCTHVVYYTDKRETPSTAGQGGLAQYVHRMGEEGGFPPLLGLDRSGRIWFAGGTYDVLTGGITH